MKEGSPPEHHGTAPKTPHEAARLRSNRDDVGMNRLVVGLARILTP
jgi:hypothetical protein